MDIEIWKPIKGFEGKFEVSNLGKVKSLARAVKPTGPYQKEKNVRERIFKPILQKPGYYNVCLEGKKFLIHRLVAMAFIENPKNYDCVNHKDGNKLNNTPENLEWCDKYINNNHAFNNGLIPAKKIKATIIIDNTQMIFRSKSKAKEYLKITNSMLDKGLKQGEIRGIKLEYIK